MDKFPFREGRGGKRLNASIPFLSSGNTPRNLCYGNQGTIWLFVLLGLYRVDSYVYPIIVSLQVFTSVALFNMLISPLNAFPWVLNGLMEAWVSVKRIQAFLSLENLDLTGYYQQLDYSDKGESKLILFMSSHSFIMLKFL